MAASKTFEQKILYTGTQAQYDAAEKDATRLYFTSDTLKLYKGTSDFSQAVRAVDSFPATGAANNVLYVQTAEGKVVKAGYTTNNGAAWTTVVLAAATAIPTEGDGADGSDAEYPTTKAVVDYVTAKVGTSGAVTEIDAGDAAGQIKYNVAGSTDATSVEVPGVVNGVTWDATNMKLTLNVTANGETAAQTVECNIGKHLVIQSGSYDATTEEIVLTLANAEQTEIRIDVSDLIDAIQTEDTDSVKTTYTAATNTIKADVNLSGKEGNYLKLISTGTDAEKGLMVDLSEIETKIETAEDNIDALYTAVSQWHAIA